MGVVAPEPPNPLVDALAGFEGALTSQPHPDAVPATSLATPAVLVGLLGRFAAAHPGADRLALASLWSQIYFSQLIIPAVARMSARRSGPCLRLEALSVRFCALTGRPLSFHGGGPAGPSCPIDPAAAMAELLDAHIAPVTVILRAGLGLSERLLRANAGWSLTWAVRAVDQATGDREAVAAITACGGRSECVSSLAAGAGLTRHVCCLRDRIPGFARCPGICPVRSTDRSIMGSHG